MLPARATPQSEDLTDAHQTMTVHVVARTSPSDPDPLRGVVLQLRHPADEIDGRLRAWDVRSVIGGSTCAGDPDSLCIPVGG